MNFRDWLNRWNIGPLKVNLQFLQMEWDPTDADKDAAWEMYIELITRITTQYLDPEHGDEKTALGSIHKIFELTREIIKKKGRQTVSFAKVAVIILNQKIRPFTAKWHKLSLEGGFDDADRCIEFREELSVLQGVLREYTRMLADLAGVEDLTSLEKDLED